MTQWILQTSGRADHTRTLPTPKNTTQSLETFHHSR